MDSGSCGSLGEALRSLGMRYHPDEDQILTTTDAPRFPTCRSLRKRNQESEDIRIVSALKLIMMLVRRISSDHCGSSGINC